MLQDLTIVGSSFCLFWFCCFAWILRGRGYRSFKGQMVNLSLDLLFFSLLLSAPSSSVSSLSLSPPFSSDLPVGSKECSGKLHQEALHQVHLSHGVLPDLPLPSAAGLAAHCPYKLAHAGTPAHYCRVDDSPMGAGCVQINLILYTSLCLITAKSNVL